MKLFMSILPRSFAFFHYRFFCQFMVNRIKYSFELWRYSLPLREPLTVPNGTVNVREGLLLVVRESELLYGIGEIAPLPNLHTETLHEAQQQVLDALPNLEHGLNPDTHLFPSVRCGIEMAFQSLEWLSNTDVDVVGQIPLNALLSGAKEAIAERAKQAVQEGYTTLKIKVGRHSLDDDIANIRAVRKAVGENILIRLDANRTWSLETALKLGFAVKDCRISFIEEPLKNWQELEEFSRKTGISIALDEMLYMNNFTSNEAEFEARNTIPNDILAAYILKPSAIGSIKTAQNLASEASKRNAQAIVSSVFESGIALSFYAALQARWNNGVSIPCGLDTFKFLDDDVISPRFTTTSGNTSIDAAFDAYSHLNFNVLSRIL